MTHPEHFLRKWKSLTHKGHLEITSRDDGYYAAGEGRTIGPLQWDAASKNLVGGQACFSLSGGRGGLFGLLLDLGPDVPVAAYLEGSRPLPAPVCGADSQLFEKLLGQVFKVRTLQVNRLRRPVEIGEAIVIRRYPERDGYLLGALLPTGFREIDLLCPHAENGTLGSHTFLEESALRAVACWVDPEDRGPRARLFSMVTIGRAAAGAAVAAAKRTAQSGAPEDLAALAQSYGLFAFELEALRSSHDLPGPGDPLIVWGADDGGG